MEASKEMVWYHKFLNTLEDIQVYRQANYTLLCKYGGYLEYQGFKTSHEEKYINGKYQVIKGFCGELRSGY